MDTKILRGKKQCFQKYVLNVKESNKVSLSHKIFILFIVYNQELDTI